MLTTTRNFAQTPPSHRHLSKARHLLTTSMWIARVSLPPPVYRRDHIDPCAPAWTNPASSHLIPRCRKYVNWYFRICEDPTTTCSQRGISWPPLSCLRKFPLIWLALAHREISSQVCDDFRSSPSWSVACESAMEGRMAAKPTHHTVKVNDVLYSQASIRQRFADPSMPSLQQLIFCLYKKLDQFVDRQLFDNRSI